MRPSPTIDVSSLPKIAFGPKSLIWWGTTGLLAIEATAFVLLFAVYFYLRGRVPEWPPGVLPPDLRWGTLNLVLFLVSAAPNYLTQRAAKRFDLRRARLWLTVTTVLGWSTIAVRVLEFTTLNVAWNTNAYGSIVWIILAVHAAHLVTDAYDTLLLNVIATVGPFEKKRFVDLDDNAMYWYFVVVSNIPVYAILYLAPRAL